MTSIALPVAARAPRGLRTVAWIGIVLGLARRLGGAAADHGPLVGVEPRALPRRPHSRHRRADPRRAAVRRLRDRGRRARLRARLPRHALQPRQARERRRLVGAVRRHVPLRHAAHLRGARRDVQRALRRRQHRPRGDDADGRLLRHPRRGQARLVVARPDRRDPLRRADGARCTRCSRSTCVRTRSSAAPRSTSSPSASRAICSSTSTARRARRPTSRRSRRSTSGFSATFPARETSSRRSSAT